MVKSRCRARRALRYFAELRHTDYSSEPSRASFHQPFGQMNRHHNRLRSVCERHCRAGSTFNFTLSNGVPQVPCGSRLQTVSQYCEPLCHATQIFVSPTGEVWLMLLLAHVVRVQFHLRPGWNPALFYNHYKPVSAIRSSSSRLYWH